MPDPVWAQKLPFIEHLRQDTAQAVLVDQRENAAFGDAEMTGSGGVD
jgi:hypothetical protein